MYSVLFKEILLEINEEDRESINNLINYCRDHGIDESQLNYFKSDYHKKTAVWWYSEEMFLYGMLNRALRSLDMEVMIKLGFFIRSLHLQLVQLHKEQAADFKEDFVVYRGQGFMQQDFQHLFDIKGGLLSFNNFLSTSKALQVAMTFVKNSMRKNKDVTGVLFVMTIDPKKISTWLTPFALIDQHSAIPSEQEILFPMHTIFRVVDIKRTAENSRLWEVQLTLSDDNDPEIDDLTNRVKGELFGSTGWHRMGHLMLKTGELNEAEALYEHLLKIANSDSERNDVYHMLGMIKNDQSE